MTWNAIFLNEFPKKFEFEIILYINLKFQLYNVNIWNVLIEQKKSKVKLAKKSCCKVASEDIKWHLRKICTLFYQLISSHQRRVQHRGCYSSREYPPPHPIIVNSMFLPIVLCVLKRVMEVKIIPYPPCKSNLLPV